MASAFLLDTCAFIDLESLDLGEYEGEVALVGAVTLGELAFGLELGDEAQQIERAKLLRDTVARYEIVPFGVEEAKLYGVLATLVRAGGCNRRPRRLDLQIAATAAAARVPLLTGNPDDFVGTGQLVEVIAIGPPSSSTE